MRARSAAARRSSGEQLGGRFDVERPVGPVLDPGDGRDLRRAEHERMELVAGADADRSAGSGGDGGVGRDDDEAGLAALARALDRHVHRPAKVLGLVDAQLHLDDRAEHRAKFRADPRVRRWRYLVVSGAMMPAA